MKDTKRLVYDLAEEFDEPVDNIEVLELFTNEEGAALYEVRILSVGFRQWIIEGKPGKFCLPFQTFEEARDEWRNIVRKCRDLKKGESK